MPKKKTIAARVASWGHQAIQVLGIQAGLRFLAGAIYPAAQNRGFANIARAQVQHDGDCPCIFSRAVCRSNDRAMPSSREPIVLPADTGCGGSSRHPNKPNAQPGISGSRLRGASHAIRFMKSIADGAGLIRPHPQKDTDSAAKGTESRPKLPILRMQHCANRITGTIWAILRLLGEANSSKNYKVFDSLESLKINLLKILWKK